MVRGKVAFSVVFVSLSIWGFYSMINSNRQEGCPHPFGQKNKMEGCPQERLIIDYWTVRRFLPAKVELKTLLPTKIGLPPHPKLDWDPPPHLPPAHDNRGRGVVGMLHTLTGRCLVRKYVGLNFEQAVLAVSVCSMYPGISAGDPLFVDLFVTR